jgi:RNA polymerase sigma-70 factor (ECF subfamily)
LSTSPEQDLIRGIRQGDPAAWRSCIAQYQGRLIAFVERRLKNRAEAEDVVQETFLGFLTSLPNYDSRTPVENFLFSIAAYKLTDALRRQGRRPRLPILISDDDGPSHEPAGRDRRASSMARSREHHVVEETVLRNCLRDLILEWRRDKNWERLRCAELLFVRGLPNKDVAARLGISEQAVANHKQPIVARLKEAGERARLLDFDLGRLGLD